MISSRLSGAARILVHMAASLFGVIAILVMAGCARPPTPLPQSGSPAETLYVSRCGACHRPYDPRSMTAAMWQIQVVAMESRIAHAGMPPLSTADRASILDYLTRNAGHE